MKKLIFLLLIITLISCSPKLFYKKWTVKKAPNTFKARFETTQGDFEIISKREWSPQAVDRLYQLIKSGFYTDIGIYRVIPKFVAQFGIHNDSVLNNQWSKYKLLDEPVLQKNDSMTIAFARGGPNSRTTGIYINLKNNNKLDTIAYNGITGFPVVAKITKGMENVHKFYDTSKNVPNQGSIHKYGNTYLKNDYPKLDYIIKAYLLK